MKRFLLFTGDTYYPAGGWQDFKGDFRSVKEALREAAKLDCGWYHIVDFKTGQIVEDNSKP